MRVFSKKVLTALRHVRRARPALLIAAPTCTLPQLICAPKPLPAIAPPLISGPLLLGSKFNPIIIDDLVDNESTDSSNSEFLADCLNRLSINNPGTGSPPHMADESGSCPSPATQGAYTLIPISEFTANNSELSSSVCLHDLRLIAKYHGFELKKMHPEFFKIGP